MLDADDPAVPTAGEAVALLLLGIAPQPQEELLLFRQALFQDLDRPQPMGGPRMGIVKDAPLC